MSGMEFIAALVAALAWPITIVVAVILLRNPLERWFQERPSRIKAGPVEVEWDAVISRVQANLDQPGVPDPAALTSSAETPDRDLYLLARANPPLAIVEASRRVEAELRQRLTAEGVEAPQEGLSALAQLAHRSGLVNAATQESVAGLVALRNLAVHAPERVSAQEALEFVALTEATLFAITAGGKERNRRTDTALGQGQASPTDHRE
jgi:hypothetical protein